MTVDVAVDQLANRKLTSGWEVQATAIAGMALLALAKAGSRD